MDTVIRVNSHQSENLTSNQNLLDFSIPSGAVYDLKKSYVSVRVKPSASLTAADGNITADARFNTAVVFNSNTSGTPQNENYFSSACLIKNARMTSEKKGVVEEARDRNKLVMWLKTVKKDEDDFLKNEYYNVMSCRDREAWGSLSPLGRFTKENGGTSTIIEKEVRIPMEDILNVGSVSQFDTSRLGKCNLNLELDLSRVSAISDLHDENYYTDNNNGAVADNGDNVARTTLELNKTYDTTYEEHLGFYIGMPVQAHTGSTVAGGDVAGHKRIITDISYNTTTGKVTLTFNNSWGTGAIASFKLKPIDNADITSDFTMNQAQIVLYQLGADKLSNVPEVIEYTKYDLEKDNANGRNSFHKNYEVSGNTKNLLVLLPRSAEGRISDLIFESHRVSVNQELLTNRDVNKNTQLSFSRMERWAENSNIEMKNMLQKKHSHRQVVNEVTEVDTGDENFLNAITEPLELTNDLKMVEIEIQSSGGVQDVLLYKEVSVSI